MNIIYITVTTLGAIELVRLLDKLIRIIENPTR